MKKIKWENKILAGLSGLCLAATALAISANTTAFAATSPEPLSPDNNYSVSVDLSDIDAAIVGLENVPAGGYVLVVTPLVTEPEAQPEFTASLGEVTKPLVFSEYFYDGYYADFEILEDSTEFEITTTLTELTTINVTLYEKVTTEALPTEGNPATLETGTIYNYNFTIDESGYYAINHHSSAAGFDIILKGHPNFFYGTDVSDSTYPVYLEKGTEYYLSVEYLGSFMGEAETASVYFSFDKWTPAAVAENARFYALVSHDGDLNYANEFTLPAEKYALNIVLLPFEYYDAHITLHVVYSDGNETTATLEDQHCTFEVVEGVQKIYLTSDSDASFVVQAVVSLAPSPSVNFTVDGTAQAVTLRANETITCYVANVTESGNYDIAIQDAEGNALESSPISVSTLYETVIAEGQNSGMFPIVLAYPNEYYPGETSTNAPLSFTNNSAEAITFYVKVTKSAGDYYFTANTAKVITAQPESRVTYFVTGITSGTYRMKLTDASGNIVIFDYINRYESFVDRIMPENLYSFGDFTLEGGRTFTYAFIVENTATTEQTFTVEFSKVNSLVLGVETQVTVEGAQNYYIGSLLTGKYMITLSNLPEGASLVVRYNGTEIVASGATVGYFDVKVPEDKAAAIAMLTIINYNAGDVTFTATVTEAPDGDMTLGVPQTITMDYTDNSKTYNIALEAGRYTLTLADVPADIEVYVYIDGAYMEFIDNVATFDIATAGTLPVEFVFLYTGEGEYTGSFSFTATITAAPVEA